jgi:hypothetical protein
MHGLKNFITALAFIAPALSAPADPVADTPAKLVGREEVAATDAMASALPGCYVLTNNFLGSNVALSSDGLMMRYYRSSDPTQIWRIQDTHTAGYYRLQSLSTGNALTLDVINDNGVNSDKVELAQTENYSGQFWRFDQWADGTYRLSNMFTGVDKHLDVSSNTYVAYLGTRDHSGQHWKIMKVGCPA